MAYQISTRFYLGITPLIFILFAFLIEWVVQIISNRTLKYLILGIASLSILLNFHATNTYLKELSNAKKIPDENHRDFVFGNERKVTLEQLRAMATEVDRNFPDHNPIFVSGESRYARSIYYILFAEKGRSGCYQKGSVEEPVFQNHILVMKNKGKTGTIPFGTLAIQLINPEMEHRSNVLPMGCLTY